jgi:hypothetical protein
MTLIYVLETPDLGIAVKTAMDIYSTTGMQPAIISNGPDNFKFNCKDAALLSSNSCSVDQYSKNNIITE